MVFLKRWPWRGVLTLLFMSLVIPVTRSEETSLVSYDSPYQHIEVREETNGLKTFRTMLLNGGYASSIDVESGQSRFGYIRQAIEATDMWTLLSSTMKPKTVLVIGAAGFTYPQEIAKRGYIGQVDALDVDPAVKEITEKYFHQHSLDSKIRFIPQSARGFLREAIDENVSYDYVLVDAYI